MSSVLKHFSSPAALKRLPVKIANRFYISKMGGLSPAWNSTVNGVLSAPAVPTTAKPILLHPFGVRADRTVRIEPGVLFRGMDIEVGPRSGIGERCIVETGVRIGRDTQIALDCRLLTWTHEITTGEWGSRAGISVRRPSKIGDCCWLGVNVTVLPGVEVADRCVIAAGAVVTRSTKPDGLYAGVPARRIKDLPGPTDAPPE